MVFNWQAFLERHHIDYRTSGPNVGADHLVIHCPMCGRNDPGEHMSISLNGKGWRCWRDTTHAGVNPNRLIMSLLNIDWSSAAAISGTSKGYQSQPVLTSTLRDRVNNLLDPPPLPKPTPIEFPKSARPLASNSNTALPYCLYLRGRGITDMTNLDKWDIRYDHRDPRFHGRILFGVRSNSHLVAITGRAVSQRMEPRYLAEGPVDQYLIWTDRMPRKADTLILTEGPFDALKVNLLGHKAGIWSTACMTSTFSPAQRAQLYDLIPRFRRTLVLFDRGNEANAYRLASEFPGRLHVMELPPYAKDPAELYDLDWLIEERDD